MLALRGLHPLIAGDILSDRVGNTTPPMFGAKALVLNPLSMATPEAGNLFIHTPLTNPLMAGNNFLFIHILPQKQVTYPHRGGCHNVIYNNRALTPPCCGA
jgi:hypothetical protein